MDDDRASFFLCYLEGVRGGFVVSLVVSQSMALRCKLSLSPHLYHTFIEHFLLNSQTFPKPNQPQPLPFQKSPNSLLHSFPPFFKIKFHLNYFIIIMFISRLRQYQPLIAKSLLSFSKINIIKYAPPPSQFQEFKKHINIIDHPDSRKEAAKLMARLENDEELYKEKLVEIEKEIEAQYQQNSHIVDVFDRTCKMELEIENQTTENREIQERCFKEIENIKIYGITRIAKEAIETLDHLKQALKIVEDSNTETRLMQISKLNQTISAFVQLLAKYEIKQFSPLNEPFNPNQQESIGQLEASDPQKKNKVAKVQRTGFKIKDRLLRSAFVIIYI